MLKIFCFNLDHGTEIEGSVNRRWQEPTCHLSKNPPLPNFRHLEMPCEKESKIGCMRLLDTGDGKALVGYKAALAGNLLDRLIIGEGLWNYDFTENAAGCIG
jgi:hypothetical protein